MNSTENLDPQEINSINLGIAELKEAYKAYLIGERKRGFLDLFLRVLADVAQKYPDFIAQILQNSDSETAQAIQRMLLAAQHAPDSTH